MLSPIVQVVADPQGLLVTLHRDGTVHRQQATGAAGWEVAWQPVSLAGLVDVRLISLAVRPSGALAGTLVGISSQGELFGQTRADFAGDYHVRFRWQRIELPEPEPVE